MLSILSLCPGHSLEAAAASTPFHDRGVCLELDAIAQTVPTLKCVAQRAVAMVKLVILSSWVRASLHRPRHAEVPMLK